jgi:uncharacterized membrane protein
MEAFSDGVLAIIITIMVLELKAPSSVDWGSLRPLIPVFLSYVLSFVLLGIYWNNHHHLLQAARRVTGGVLWANMHLLFWLSLTPFATAWMGENHYASLPVALYGGVQSFAAIAYYILTRTLITSHGQDSTLARAVGSDAKGKVSLVLWLFAMVVAFYRPLVSCAIYVLVAAVWLIPDRRIERIIAE